MAHKLIVIATREDATMVSAWNEYLCLAQSNEHRYRLFTGRYEGLAERSQYYNEETGDYDLPEMIEGKAVVGLEDDYVVGGDLSFYNDSEAVEFVDIDEAVVAAWLEDSNWSRLVGLDALRSRFRVFSTDM